MRALLVAGAFLMAGCTVEESPGEDPVSPLGPLQDPLPADIHVNTTMPPSTGDNVGNGQADCSFATVICHSYPFALARGASVTIRLVANQPVIPDLDLYLVSGAETLAASESGESRTEFVRVALAAGNYEVIVQGSRSVGADYQVDVWFDEPRAPNP